MDSDQILKRHKLKVTSARKALIEVFNSTKLPIDSQTVLSKIEEHGISPDPATIFRMLNTFTEHGILRQIQLHEGKFRYERADLDEHHHIICQNCGKIEDISDCNMSGLEKDIEKKKGFEIKSHSLEFYGLCKNCK